MTERRERIKQHVVKHAKKYEGRRPNVYLDPKGIPTIGYGYALGDKNGNIKSTADINAEMNRAMNTQGKLPPSTPARRFFIPTIWTASPRIHHKQASASPSPAPPAMQMVRFTGLHWLKVKRKWSF